MVTADGSTFRIERVKPRVKTSLHEILKYKLNNLHVQIFMHVVCFYFACYSSILVALLGYHNIVQVQCSAGISGLRNF